MRVGRKLDLAGVMEMAGAGTCDLDLAATEDDAALLGAVACGGSVWVVLALGAHDLVELLFHHQSHDLEPDADRERQQTFLDGSGELPQRYLYLLRQGESGSLVLLDDARCV